MFQKASIRVPSSPCNKSDRSAPFSKSLGSNPFCLAISCADILTISDWHSASLISIRNHSKMKIYCNSRAYGGSQPNDIFRRSTTIDKTYFLRWELWIYNSFIFDRNFAELLNNIKGLYVKFPDL